MKKIIIFLAIIISILIMTKEEEKSLLIPTESIRIRIIANSNSLLDQLEKQKVRENIQIYLNNILKDAKTKEETEIILKNNLENLDKEINNTLDSLNSNNKYYIAYGNNYFPKKEYKGKVYDAGYYESLVITLGKGTGNNWWCVLFPPLCLMETEEENMNNIEYKLYINEILSKYN